ncbi:MAG: hypothetical protein JWO82_14 [Akkermansiaceae bacterium]|nr:hypothetical protein [Akkermansiaceae bacterium]
MDTASTAPSARRLSLPFESNRTFVVSGYAHGHGVLLLRSYHPGLEPTRIDLLFKDVWALDLRFHFEGIRIEEVEPDFLNGRPSAPAEMMHPGLRAYAFRGQGWEGFLLAGNVWAHEGEGGPAERSLLMGPPMEGQDTGFIG